ncbi:uncharacterized protein LOC116159121 [Photinus pyralis]|uniref:uncharacterized protein LOC116159121 n=1 Tax=Photinus pyralis TaxID=7054 RepID=UPI0012672680|nr:uncharacterized protein LOC116159121 [Photinus pyralis]
MSALNIIEHPSFLALFKGMNVKVPSRKTLMKRISEHHELNMCDIKQKLSNIDFVSTTADIWSNKRRSFLGVTVHWIEEDSTRGSAAIACKRFMGTHSYRNIAEILENINFKFGLTQNKIVGTITDNGSNFVKAFKEFHADEDKDLEEEDVFSIANVDNEDPLTTESFSLPKHVRCASHTLNLIGTTDYKNFLGTNTLLRTRHTNAFFKCRLLWHKANRPKSNEIIQKILGHTLSSPGVTRWTYDSVNQIIQEKRKLATLSRALELQPFKDTKLLYLEEYCAVMKPLADTLDFLQGENNTFFGFLLPSLLSLSNRYEKMLQSQRFIYGGDQITQMCLDSLRKRFSDLLNLRSKEAVFAAVLLPQFKFRWYNVVKHPTITIDDIKKQIVEVAEKIDREGNTSPNSHQDDALESLDEFFDFSGTGDNGSMFTVVDARERCEPTSASRSTTTKIELELLRYLEDKASNIHSLNEYPRLKKLSTQFNTCLPSSGPVERLFSFATIIDAPRRNGLTDENFEILVLSKANNK